MLLYFRVIPLIPDWLSVGCVVRGPFACSMYLLAYIDHCKDDCPGSAVRSAHAVRVPRLMYSCSLRNRTLPAPCCVPVSSVAATTAGNLARPLPLPPYFCLLGISYRCCTGRG